MPQKICSGPTRRLLLPLVLGAAAGFTAIPIEAAVITVTSTADVLAVDGECTLREALLAANTNVPVGDCGAGEATDPVTHLPVDLIVFADLPGSPDVYRLTIAGRNEDFGTTGDLDIWDSVTLVGNGSHETIIDGDGLDRVLHVMVTRFTVNAIIESITVRGGSATRGAGIYNFVASLTISNSHVTANEAKCSPNTGCPGDTLPITDTVARGGGIFTQGGTLSIVQSSITENAVTCSDVDGRNGLPIGCAAHGGGVYVTSDGAGAATVTVVNSLIAGNLAQCLGCDAAGGGIYRNDTFGTMSLETAFSGFDARNLYVQNVAHSLALEIGGFVPWSILTYDQTDLHRILASPYLFDAGNYHSGTPNAPPVDFAGWWPFGGSKGVTPAPRTVTFQFLVDNSHAQRAADFINGLQPASAGYN